MNDQTKQLIPYGIIGLFISLPIMCLLATHKYLSDLIDIEDRKTRYFLYFLLAMIPAMINTTKPVGFSDLGYYAWLYDYAGQKTFSEYLILIPKEPLYHIYNYVIRFITFGEFKLFVIITSLLMYLPVMFAFDIIVRKNNIPCRVGVYASIILLLFPQYFFYTMQIVRQVLAGSIAFYCVIRSIYYNDKISLIGVFCAGFIHASAFIFSFFYIFKLTYNWGLFAKLILLAGCGLSFYALLGAIASTSAEGSTLAYAASRGLSDNNEIVSVGLFPRLVSLSIFPLGILAAYKIRRPEFYTFLSVSWVIVGIILLKWNTPLFVLRFMEYAYMYIPICLALFLYSFGKERFIPIISAGMILFFCYGITHSDFGYLSIDQIIIRGALLYFI